MRILDTCELNIVNFYAKGTVCCMCKNFLNVVRTVFCRYIRVHGIPTIALRFVPNRWTLCFRFSRTHQSHPYFYTPIYLYIYRICDSALYLSHFSLPISLCLALSRSPFDHLFCRSVSNTHFCDSRHLYPFTLSPLNQAFSFPFFSFFSLYFLYSLLFFANSLLRVARVTSIFCRIFIRLSRRWSHDRDTLFYSPRVSQASFYPGLALRSRISIFSSPENKPFLPLFFNPLPRESGIEALKGVCAKCMLLCSHPTLIRLWKTLHISMFRTC